MIENDRFWSKVEKGNGCWEWTSTKREGYGVFHLSPQRTTRHAHVLSYETLVGPVPSGMVVHHKCENRSCVNPDHLSPMTRADHINLHRDAVNEAAYKVRRARNKERAALLPPNKEIVPKKESLPRGRPRKASTLHPRNKSPRKSLLVTNIPTDIRKALVDDARSQDVSVNEVAVRILCGCFNVKHVESLNGLRGQDGPPGFAAADPKNTTLLIRGGAKLHREMDRARRKRNATLRGVALECLALNYELPAPAVSRRPRQTKGTTA